MAAIVQRHYNQSSQQLHAAIQYALDSCGMRGWRSGEFVYSGRVGIRWLGFSWGENVHVRVSGPGAIEVSSRYVLPTQVFELGDNLQNVERVVASIEEYLRRERPACPHCNADLISNARYCLTCGAALHEMAGQAPLQRLSTRTRLLAVFAFITVLGGFTLLLYLLFRTAFGI